MEKTGIEPWMERYTSVGNPPIYAMSYAVLRERLKNHVEISKWEWANVQPVEVFDDLQTIARHLKTRYPWAVPVQMPL